MSRTIANTLTTGITLSPSDNPVSITATGRITAASGDAVYGYTTGSTPWTVSNSGTLVDHDGTSSAVHLKTMDYAINSIFTNQSGGLVSGTHNGVVLNGSGAVINQTNATITSTDAALASGVYIAGNGTVVNAGLIQAGNVAVYELLGGSVTNLATGTISGAGGIYLKGAATVTNAGTVIGTNPAYGAVLFDSSTGSSRLIVDPGAVFSGKIMSLANSTNVVELASGSSAGTLVGFDGSSITNFATLQFDAGANWTVKGNSAATGLGSIAITGFTLGDTIDLTGFVAVSKTFASNALVLTNASNAHATLHIQGSFSSSSFALTGDGGTGTDILMAPPHLAYGQTIDKAGIVATSETVTAGTMTLFNGGGTAVSTIAVGTTLTTGDFTLKPDGAGGTNVIVKTVFGTYASGVTLLTNPTTIAATGHATNTAPGGKAVSGPSGTNWTLVNNGLVSETASNGTGVSFAQSGTITNAFGGTINGASFGIAFGSGALGGVVTNQSGGVITGASNAIHFAPGSGAGTVSNSGIIAAIGTAAFTGINLTGGGVISNASGGTITGQVVGIYIAGGTVSNAGSIGATVYDGIWLTHAGTVTNATGGTIMGSYSTNAAGIYLQGGGSVINQSGGLIGGLRGVYALTIAATVVNTGHINGSGTAIGAATPVSYGGVYLGAGGSVTNNAGGTISGYDGVNVKRAAATVVNAGQITGDTTANTAAGVTLAAGGSVTNQAGGTITGYTAITASGGAATVVNAGLIAGNSTLASADGVYLHAGGSVTNQLTGTISADNAIVIRGAAGTVVNLGRIVSKYSFYGNNGVYLANGGLVTNGAAGSTASAAYIAGYGGGVRFGAAAAGTLVNFGTVSGLPGRSAVQMDTGTIINGPSGTTGALIRGGDQTNAIQITGVGTVVNYATIVATELNGDTQIYYGVRLGGTAGSVSNLGAHSLIQDYVAVYGTQNDTITNAGTMASVISGLPGAAAVVFGGGTNRLIIDPGAVFIGKVSGSGPVTLAPSGSTTVIGTANGIGSTTMELASGSSAGSLSGLGTQFTGFAQTTVDAGAAWTLTGQNTIAAGTILTNAGTLTNTGTLTLTDATLNGAGSMINNGGIVLDPSTMTVTDLLGAGAVTIAAGSTLEVTGSIASTETILLNGTAAYLHLDNPAGVTGHVLDLSIGETIDLKGIIPTSVHESAGFLTIDDVGGFALTLSAGDQLVATASADGTALTATIACFAEGTAIATSAGPVPVEALRAGDLVRTASGATRPVRWIGYRTLDLTRHPAPERAQPIRIAANAFADNVPSRDLRLSPDHAVLLDGLLIPVKLLRNDASIVRETDCRSVTYYHVELDTHDILLAEGLAAESYIDTGNRCIFQNGGLPLALHPNFEHAQAQREATSCAPFATDPARVEPVWQTLTARATASGLGVSDTPSHTIIAAGRIIRPLSQSATCLAFLLPAVTHHVRLVSSGTDQPWIDDPRPRGAAVTRLTLRTGATVETLALDHPSLRDGWWDTERRGDQMWRWTNGDATISLNTDRPAILEVRFADTARPHHPRRAA